MLVLGVVDEVAHHAGDAIASFQFHGGLLGGGLLGHSLFDLHFGVHDVVCALVSLDVGLALGEFGVDEAQTLVDELGGIHCRLVLLALAALVVDFHHGVDDVLAALDVGLGHVEIDAVSLFVHDFHGHDLHEFLGHGHVAGDVDAHLERLAGHIVVGGAQREHAIGGVDVGWQREPLLLDHGLEEPFLDFHVGLAVLVHVDPETHGDGQCVEEGVGSVDFKR